MSTSKKAKKGSDQIPKPIGIKKEKLEEDRTLHHISHYIDDRLELVKQIFATLKPKTIINLAPEFLKKAPLEEIEERCLDELLCISTKRLKSIIEDKLCPSDTESSEDSDVQHKEEHISLEEISSDSDIGDSRRAKKRNWLVAKKPIKKEQNEETDGQISVLELLELQARARAIRSQLAMEPITKIEVKSDDEDEDTPSNVDRRKQAEKSKSKSSKSASKGRERSESQRKRKSIERLVHITDDNSREGVTKKIKIKRNYRQTNKTPERQVIEEITEVTIGDSPAKDRSRSASPDVIPIQTETETLLISDSTDEDEQVSTNKDKGQQQNNNQKAALEQLPPAPLPQPAEPAVESEPEEGEVRDEVETKEKPSENNEAPLPEKEAEKETTTEAKDPIPATEESPKVPTAVEENSNCSQQSQVASTGGAVALSLIEDEDQNDDVISIGGDLENEMIEQLAKEEPTPSIKSETEREKKSNDSPEDEMDNDVISLDTSEDDHEKLQPENSESWRTRYLKSSKVSQVLAESRLGKRVRDKIKKSKRAQKHDKDGKDASASNAGNDEQKSKAGGDQQFTSKHEDGSIEQYQELLQHRQRKSSNNSSKSDK
ncbi:transcriptional regulator ATRX homolog [Drosophila tropicalis]|uniref:transcriptional regulator ATRX homolog n=1 Tax=Drosophila tropicalis TaxID=46794 RepID=UPI0035AC2843